MDVISRKDAIAAGLKWYFTGKQCKHGHIAKRIVSGKSCNDCNKISFAKWESTQLERRAEQKREKRKSNPEHFRKLAKNRYSLNPEKYRDANKRNYMRNKHLYISGNKKRKHSLTQNMPKWADAKEIRAIYKQAAEMSKREGINYHVDHIIPLHGKNVSGLHIALNLQILTAKENLTKGNKCPE